MPGKKFTDNQLAQLHLMLARDYKELQQAGYTPDVIYQNLEYKVRVALTNPNSALYGLGLDPKYGLGLDRKYPYGFDPNRPQNEQFEEQRREQYKVYNVLNTLFQARQPALVKKSESRPEINFVFHIIQVDLESDNSLHYYRRPHYYCATNDTLFTWLMLDSIMHHHSPHTHIGSGSSYHGHSSTNKDDAVAQALALLLLAALIALVVVLAMAGLCYMLLETLDSAERFWYNEGWLQAAVSLASGPASGYATGVLAANLFTAPLTSLALAAGVSNPVGLVVFGIICLSIAGAGAGCFLTNKIQDSLLKKYNPQALDPQDPHRFTLTEEEEENLIFNGLDPIKVKCAMVALREQMGTKQVPYLLNRIFCSGSEKQTHLDKIRQLRRGDLREVDVGTSKNKSHYDLNLPPPQYQQYPYSQQPYSDSTVHHHPSYQQQQPQYYSEGYPPTYNSPMYT